MNDKKDCQWGCVDGYCLSFAAVYREDNCIIANKICSTCGKKYPLRGNYSCPHCEKKDYESFKENKMNITHNGID